ncbi:sugar ABC transporter ATP-binding protein [Ktedonobacteria bacterium brp13]|nr:sugar ABC transporter ATP-binding protein [Ktedonobacteria bacterium brp13]
MSQNPPLLQIDHVQKGFPGVQALVDANLTIQSNEIHALVGQNGAGKSTLIKILTGAYHRDSGNILFAGRSIDFKTPQQAQRNGISTIYQEINLIPFLSISENIFLGREPRRFGFIDWPRMHAESHKLLERISISIDVRKPLMTYNIAIQQMVALARAVSFESRLVVMDEPTSSLNDQEVQVLFSIIRQLKSDGVSVMFVGHRLDELFEICDRVTIMRDGRTVGASSMDKITRVELVATMLGKELGEVQRGGETNFDATKHHAEKQTLLDAHDLRYGHKLRGASLKLQAGEIVGLAGLLGSGRSELARALFGAEKLEGGTVDVADKPIHFSSPRDAIRAHIGFCSEDRKAEGIIPYLSVRDNLTLAALPLFARYGIVSHAKQRQVVDQFIRRLGIKTSGPEQKIRELSGGNQQKVLLARWLCLNPQILILDEPTRGIDVGARAEIQGIIEELAESGVGVLMISSDLEELTEGSDRIVVLRDGMTVSALTHEQISQDAIMVAMAQGTDDAVQATTLPDEDVVPSVQVDGSGEVSHEKAE